MSDPHSKPASTDPEPEDAIRWGLVYSSVIVFAVIVIALIWWFSRAFTPPSLR